MPKVKREFDRRSGTGRGKEIAKNGAGKGNWGTMNDTLADADQNAGRPGPISKRKEETKVEGSRYFDEYKKELSGKPVPVVASTSAIQPKKKTGKMSLAEFQAMS
ncbi:hypothetical protein AAMO2058_000270500 [Amorphochlora amoebiformis]|eukprot:1328790-Amorphochlora_amoeboformis.AAC.2